MLQEKTGFDDNKAIAGKLGQIAELKKYMKKVMPFVMVAKVSSYYHSITQEKVLLNILVTVKAAPYEFVNRTGLL